MNKKIKFILYIFLPFILILILIVLGKNYIKFKPSKSQLNQYYNEDLEKYFVNHINSLDKYYKELYQREKQKEADKKINALKKALFEYTKAKTDFYKILNEYKNAIIKYKNSTSNYIKSKKIKNKKQVNLDGALADYYQAGVEYDKTLDDYLKKSAKNKINTSYKTQKDLKKSELEHENSKKIYGNSIRKYENALFKYYQTNKK